MADLVPALICAAALAATAAVLILMGRRVRRRAIGSVLEVANDVFHPGAHVATAEIREQRRKVAPRTTPDDL